MSPLSKFTLTVFTVLTLVAFYKTKGMPRLVILKTTAHVLWKEVRGQPVTCLDFPPEFHTRMPSCR